jgi:glycosyltransferase involved in cell wall biosynthesis
MIKVFIICSGIGYLQRGFESFSQEIFDAISQYNSFDITLFKGNGKPSSKEIVLWNLPYYGWIARELSKFFKKPDRRDPYFIQQVSFFVSLIPHIHFHNPDIIYFIEPTIGTLLWRWRSLTKQNYQLLLCNGGPCTPTILYRWNHIHQVAPTHLRAALNIGIPTEKQTVIPHAIHISSELQVLSHSERKVLRHKLELPEEQTLLISVGAINTHQKRMDYLIREIALLPVPRPYLLLLGHQGRETAEIFQLASTLLGADNFQIRSVAKNEVADYYKVADAFVLASLQESFGLVYLEAMSYGLPCLAHDYEITQFILGKEGYLANFELTGSLASLIPQALAESHDISKRIRRHRTVYERFSWDKLRPEYVKLIQQCVDS